MAVILYHVGRTPGQNQFGLAQFTEHYKSDSKADVVLTDASTPDIGDAHPDFPHLYVTDRHVSETPDKGAALDVTYTGGGYGSGAASSDLPAKQHSSEHQVASATSYSSDLIWPVMATIPATLQFYAQTKTLTYFWPDASTWTDEPDDPDLVTSDQVITWTLAGTQPASSIPGLVDWLLNHGFVQAITKTNTVRENIAGQYYQITVKKTRTLLPYAPAS